MKTRNVRWMLLLLVGLFFILHAGGGRAIAQHTMPSEDVIVQWNDVSLSAIQTAQYRATQASRVLAMVHAAMFDTINNIDKTCQPYHIDASAPSVISREAAVAAAAHRVLENLFPAQQAAFDAALDESLMHVPGGAAANNGRSFGTSIADQILALRANDHSDDMVPYTPGLEPGQWRPTPPDEMPAMAPHWATVTPFAMTGNTQFRPVPPPALDSAEYAEELNDIKAIGAKVSGVRSQEQSDVAMFWMDMPGTITTVGRWNKIAQHVAAQRLTNMWQNARLFALLNITLADAGIAAWDSKYEYNFWRPITAIREADTDDNPLTDAEEDWEPFIMTPAFPEYVSAHSLFSAAAAGVLADFFGTDNIDFDIHPYMMHGTPRTYHSFAQAAEEAGMSRIYGGIHFISGNVNALTAGHALAQYVVDNFLRPLNLAPDAVRLRVSGGDGFVNMADGRLMYMFGFGNLTGVPDDLAMEAGMLAAEFPGPTIVVKEGQQVYLDLTNVGMLVRPDLFDPHTVHWHGFANAAPVFDGVPDASISINMGATLTYYYNVVDPGTYMWHCHVEATEHMQMGMLGNLYVLPRQNELADGADLNGFTHRTGYRYIYNDGDGSTFHHVDYPLQLSSFDPEFHDASFAVQPLPFALMKDTYPMINGRGYPDTVNPAVLWNTADEEGYMARPSQPVNSLIKAVVGEKIALRLSNLSTTDYYTFKIPGIPMKVVGTGARLLRGPDGKDTSYWTTSVTLGGGQAYDVILDTAGIAPGVYVAYAAELNQLSNDTEDYGGIMTEIHLSAGQ